MKKSIVMLLGFVLISAFSMTMTSPAKASITMADWRPTYISKNSGSVVYKDGETASLLVIVENNIGSGYMMNISKITINFFEIGKNKTLDLAANPHQLLYPQTKTFTVSFQASQADFYSDLQFDYTIIVEWVNATTGPMKIVGNWHYHRWEVEYEPFFEVYSAAQADSAMALSKYYQYYNNYDIEDLNSILALQKANQAIMEKSLGDQYLSSHNYASALTQYNAANTLWEEALAAELNWSDTWEDANLNAKLTESAATMMIAEATKAQADAAITNAYGWYFIGIGFAIGWSLMGIGVIIWAWRRPKPPI